MVSMTPRERVIRVLNHQEADMVPMDLSSTKVTSITKEAYGNLEKYLGVPHEERPFLDYLQGIVQPTEQVLQKLDVDLRRIDARPTKAWRDAYVEGCETFYDEWGIKYRTGGNNFYDPVDYAIREATLEAVENHPWPDVHDTTRFDGLVEEAKYLYENTDYAIVADMYFDSFFLQALQIRGFTNFYGEMIEEPEFAHALLNKMADVYVELLKEYIGRVGKYVQIVCIADDLGSQRGPLISKSMYREFIKPHQARIISTIKSLTDAKVMMHSCGSVYEFIPDFIDVGLDVLEAVQTSAANMQPEKLKAEFGDKISFFGAIDTQSVLTTGTPQQVKDEVKRVLEIMAPGGGYILSPSHNIQPTISPENVVAMYEAAREFGKY